MATIWGHHLLLQSVQKIMTKAMLPLVRLADSFLLPVWTALACSPVQTCIWTKCTEGFKAALLSRYKGLTNVPDPPTELLFGDLDNWMKDLDEKAKLEDTLQPVPPPKFTKVTVHPSAGKAYTPRSTTKRANYCLPSSSSASKKLASFPHNGQPVNDFRGTTQRDEVTLQKVNTFLFTPLVDLLASISQCYETRANITTDSFVQDIVKHDIKLDFFSNYTPRCSLTAEGAKAVMLR